jgi:transcriptional regulator with XRE-family HTH domain
MDAESADRNLEDAMNDRRIELGVRWEEVARRGGLSVAQLRRFRKGIGPRTPDTTRAVERALTWDSGHVASILSGPRAENQPRQAGDEQPSGDDRMEELQAEFDRLEEQVRQMRRLLNQQRRRQA